jgi:hypothetical protein
MHRRYVTMKVKRSVSFIKRLITIFDVTANECNAQVHVGLLYDEFHICSLVCVSVPIRNILVARMPLYND